MCLQGISEKTAILEKNMLTLLFRHGLDFEPRIVFSAQRSGRKKAREVNLSREADSSCHCRFLLRELAVQHLEIKAQPHFQLSQKPSDHYPKGAADWIIIVQMEVNPGLLGQAKASLPLGD